MAHAARALRMGVMLGCMLESGLGIAAGCCVAPLCDHVDLDGNLLLREDPWPGVEFVDGVQVPSLGAGPRRLARMSEARPRRLLVLGEGFSHDPHYGKTMRGIIRYGPDPVVAILDSRRAGGGARRASRSSERSRTRSRTSRPSRSWASRRRAGASRPRGASS